MQSKTIIVALGAGALAACILLLRADPDTPSSRPTPSNHAVTPALSAIPVRDASVPWDAVQTVTEATPVKDSPPQAQAPTRPKATRTARLRPRLKPVKTGLTRSAKEKLSWKQVLGILSANLPPDTAKAVAQVLEDECLESQAYDSTPPPMTAGQTEGEHRAAIHRWAGQRRQRGKSSEIRALVPDREQRNGFATPEFATAVFDSCPYM